MKTNSPPKYAVDRLRARAAGLVERLADSRRAASAAVFAHLALGIALWLAVQGLLLVGPLLGRATFPEADDIFGYLNKTVQMAECFFQTCPALEDLRQQLLIPSETEAAAAQRDLAVTRVFPIYHYLLSLVLLGISALGPDLIEAYKILWTLAPLFFCGGFAYLLWALWGPGPAGAALILTAFKVFPDSGLNQVVPSNLAMGLFCYILARIVHKRGDAPWALVLGALALVSLHPVGRVYAVMAAMGAWLLKDGPLGWRASKAPLASVLVVVLSFIIPALMDRPYSLNLSFFGPGDNIFVSYFHGLAASAVEIGSNWVRLSQGLFGPLPIFLGLIAWGFAAAEPERRRAAGRLAALYLAFLAALFHYGPTQPADGFLRIWIPFLFILFGAVGQSFWWTFGRAFQFLADKARGRRDVSLRPVAAWPLVLLAVLIGYAGYTMLRGAEQVYATMEYKRDRQPLALDPGQVDLLLDRARPGDRVLYDSMIVMPFYFTEGALRLGAVYFHPDLADSPVTRKWLAKPDVRFAAVYNPLIRRPEYEGVDEHKWWITSPDFRHSPLSDRRTRGPLSFEGVILAQNFRWLEIMPTTRDNPARLILGVDNPGPAVDLIVAPVAETGMPRAEHRLTAKAPAGFTGDLEFTWPTPALMKRLRVILPGGATDLRLTGISFGDDPLRWPWPRKALVTFQERGGGVGPITVHFDPAAQLPPPLNARPVTVLNDDGSSVLIQIGNRPSRTNPENNS